MKYTHFVSDGRNGLWGKTFSCSCWFFGLITTSLGGFIVKEVKGRVVRFYPENNVVRKESCWGILIAMVREVLKRKDK